MGDGTAVRGGGISFHYGNPGDHSKGLRISITELPPNATNNSSLQVTVWWNGTTKVGDATIPNPYTTTPHNSASFLPVRIAMSAEGRPQVWVNNVLAFDKEVAPGWPNVDKSLWAFSITGTTGTANTSSHTVRNLVIGTSTDVLPPGLSFDSATGQITGTLGLGTSVDPYVNITATNAAGSTTQLLKLDVSASNTLPGQRPGSGTSLGGDNALGASGEQFRNLSAFAALTNDGQVKVWGNTLNGGLQSDAPTGTGYTLITSNEKAFAALRNDGSIVSWGFSGNGATGEPTGTGYQMLAATRSAFAAIRSDGSITAWGDSTNGGFINPTATSAPTGTGYLRLFANGGGFVAQKIDGTLRAWGNNNSIGTVSPAVPTTTTFNRVTVNDFGSGTNTYGSFAGLKSNGITAWGSSTTGGTTGAPGTGTFQDIVATSRAFAAIDSTGTIRTWGDSLFGGGTTSAGFAYLKPPTDSGYRQIYANNAAFVALRQDGSLSAWGSSLNGGSGAPTGTGYVQVFSTLNAFAGLKADGSISVWGSSLNGLISDAPVGNGFTKLFSSNRAFAALDSQGRVTVWGNSLEGGTNGPTGTGWVEITSSGTAFAARKSDGTLYAWGSSTAGGSSAPAGSNFLTVQSPTLSAPYFPKAAGAPITFTLNQTVQAQLLTGIQGDGLNFTITNGTLPAGLKLDASTGWIYGNPAEPGTFPLTINATGAAGSVTQTYTLKVESSLLPNQRQGAGAVYTIGSGTEMPNQAAFAGLTANGGIYAWGLSDVGGSEAPTGTGYTQITANSRAYAALRSDGSITAWGKSDQGGSGAPSGTGFTRISSSSQAFAALSFDGSITAWGHSGSGGSGAPTGTGYTKIYSGLHSFAALKADGGITVWGDSSYLSGNTPAGVGYVNIVPNGNAYAALKVDGSITAWGNSTGGGSGAPTGTGYTKIFASQDAYAALRNDGSIDVWGKSERGGASGPSGTGFVDLWSSANGFAALKTDGSLVSWGATGTFNTATPSGTGYTQVFSTGGSFAALKADGSIASWGASDSGGTGAPTGTGYTTLYSNNAAFVALKADGSLKAWGSNTSGASGAPSGTGYTQVFSRKNAFAAMKADGTVSVWGSANSGGSGSSGQVEFSAISNATAVVPAHQFGLTTFLPAARTNTLLSTQAKGLNGVAGFQVGAPAGLGLGSAITAGSLPAGVTLNVATGFLEGTPTSTTGSPFNFTVTTYNGTGQSSQNYSLNVLSGTTSSTTAPYFDTTKSIGYANYAVGKPASYDLTAVGSSLNYSRIAGTLPPGMTLQTTGTLTGTPTTPGTYQFTIAASDKNGVAAQTFTIKVSGDTPNQRPGQYSAIAAGTTGSQGINESAFAALRPNGSIITWGDSAAGGAGASGVPTDLGYVQIAQTNKAFAGLRYDGAIQSWGNTASGGLGAPTDSGYTRLFSNGSAFAALKADGGIVSWGADNAGGSGEPTGTGYSQIFTSSESMVALKADGSLVAWGNSATGGSNAPTGTGYVTITANATAFAALKADGSIAAWGNSTTGGLLPALPTNNSYTAIYSTPNGFAALRADGTIATWGATNAVDKPFPGGKNFISVAATESAFAALKSDGTITTWGTTHTGGSNGPTGTGFTAIYSTQKAFAGLKSDGSISSWGSSTSGGNGSPPGTGYTQIVSNTQAFTAIKNDGTLRSWGNGSFGGAGKSPTGSGFTQVFSTNSGFVGQKTDGSLVAWGSDSGGGAGAPTGTGLTVSSALARVPYQVSGTTGRLPTAYVGTPIGADGGAGPAAYQVGAFSQGAYSQITAGALPGGLTLDPATGFLSGTPSGLAGNASTGTPSGLPGTYAVTITTTSPVGSVNQQYMVNISDSLAVIAPGQRLGSAITNAGNTSNLNAFAALTPNGSISTWGDPASGGTGAPTGTGFTQVFSNRTAFTALRRDGSLSSWGNTLNGGSNAPTGTGFSQVFATSAAFAALKTDGSLVTWGDAASGGSGAPTGTGYTQVFANGGAFAGLKADGSLTSWGDGSKGGSGAPTGTGFTRVFVNDNAFAALKADGSITAWGQANAGGSGAPTGNNVLQVFSTTGAFAAIRTDGSIATWGNSAVGGVGAPTTTGFKQLFATGSAFAALHGNGAISTWGDSTAGGSGFSGSGTFSRLSATSSAFAALKADGSIVAWGNTAKGGTNAPAGTGFTQVFATSSAFAALKGDGSITAWGDGAGGGTGAPAGTGFTQVFANSGSFAAMKADGSITTWGNAANGGTGAPAGTGYLTVQTGLVSKPAFAAFPASSTLAAKAKQAFFADLGTQGVGCRYEITVGSLPTGMTLDANTGVLSGIPAAAGNYAFIVSASNPSGVDSQQFRLEVEPNITTPSIISPGTATATVGKALNVPVMIEGDTTGVTYAITKGNLPAGLTLDPATGVLAGIPAATSNGAATGGLYSFEITASNSAGLGRQEFSLTLNQAPQLLTSSTSITRTPGLPFNVSLNASGFPAPTFRVISGTLPSGLELSSNGLISGVADATSLGKHSIIVAVSNEVGSAANLNITLSMEALPATALKILAPSDVVSGKGNTFEVQAVDSLGNLDTTATGTVTLAATGSGSLEKAGSTGLITANLNKGLATFSDLIYQASSDGETFTVSASNSSLKSAVTQAINTDVVATELQILGTPSTSIVQSGVVQNFTGLRLAAVDSTGRIDRQWLASGQSVRLSLTGPGDTPLSGVVTGFSLAGTNPLVDSDTSDTTITLQSDTIGSDGSLDLGTLQLKYTNPTGSAAVPLVLKAERLGGTGAAITGIQTSGLTSSSTPILNSAPQLTLDLTNAPGLFNENGNAMAIVGPNASVSDSDQALQSLQILITNVQAGDLLALATTPSTLTANYDPSVGSLLIKAVANAAPSLTDFQNALLAVRYSNSSDNPDTTTRQILVTANDGTSLANATVTAAGTLTVTAVDDPTTLTNLPGAINATEDTTIPLNLSGLVLSDPDDGDSPQTLTLTVTKNSTPSGSLHASNGPGVTVTGSSTSQLTLVGTIRHLSNFLQTSGVLTFRPESNANGSHALSFVLGSGSSSQILGSTTINVAAENDPGVFSGLPAAADVARLRHGQATSLQSLIGAAPISFSDLDIQEHANVFPNGAGHTGLVLTVNNANLDGLGTGTYPSGVALTVQSATRWIFNGTVAQINALIADPAITLQSVNPGAVTLDLFLYDNSYVTGGTTTATTQFLAVSDPVINNPASSSARAISAGYGESLGFLSIFDPDAGSAAQTLTLTISAPASTVTLSGLTDAESGTAGIQLIGTAAEINASLNKARYMDTELGSTSLQLSLSNGLNQGLSSIAYFSASDTLPTITQINNLTGAKEDQQFAISFSDLGAVADETDRGGSVDGFVVKAVSNGTLKIGGSAQNASPWAAGSNDTITPTQNAYWSAPADSNGTGSQAITAFTVTALDNNQAESTTPVAVKVEVNPVNDAPSLTGLPIGGSAVTTGLSSALTDFSVDDIDSNTLTLTLQPVNGNLGGLIDADNAREGIQLSGSATQINAAIAAATFTAATSGAAEIKLELEDGGSEKITGVYKLTAVAANNPPSLSSSGSTRTITTGVEDALGYITVSESDLGQSLTLTLASTAGTFRNLADADLISAGIQLNGTVSAVNAALQAGAFVANANGSGTISVSVDDGVITTPITASYSFNATNAAPTLTQVGMFNGAKEDQSYKIRLADLLEGANEADAGGGVIAFEVTSVDSSKGTLTINGSAYNGVTNNLINADRQAVWTPAPNSNGTINGAFHIKAVDEGGLKSSTSVPVSFNVIAVNDAPQLSAGSHSLAGTNEDSPSAAVTVATLLGNRISDADGDPIGIAIQGATGVGSWQYLTGSGGTWTNIGTLSTTQALILAGSTQVRYAPNGTGGESGAAAPSLSFHAWDGSDGSAEGDLVDVSDNGTATAFSSLINTASITVSAVDDPLSLTLSRATTSSNNVILTSFNYQELDLDGVAGNDLVLLDAGLTLNDPDNAETLTGVKLIFWSGFKSAEDRLELLGTTPTGSSIQQANKTFTVNSVSANVNSQYNIADGILYLSTTTAQSEAFWQAVLREVGYRNIDNSPSTGTRQIVMLADDARQTARLQMLRDSAGTPHFYEYVTATNLSWSSAETAANNRSYFGMSGYLARIKSGTENSLLAGLVPSGNDAWIGASDRSTEGTWKWISGSEADDTISGSDYTNWASGEPNDGTYFWSASEDYAVMDANGEWFDISQTSDHYLAEYSLTLSPAFTFSKNFNIVVSTGNDAPVLAQASPSLSSINEDNLNDTGQQISTFILSGTITDPDGSPALEGVAITALSSGRGGWEYRLNNSGAWLPVGEVSDTQSLLLSLSDAIRFVPNGENATAADFSYRAWDQTSGVSGTKVDTSDHGAMTAFSSTVNTASIIVTAVNDAPSWEPTSPGPYKLGSISEGDPSNLGHRIRDLILEGVDIDLNTTLGAALVATNEAFNSVDLGDWQVSVDNGNVWTPLTGISGTSARLLNPDDRIRFSPSGAIGGTATVDLRLWDRSSGLAGNLLVNPGAGGGSSATSTTTKTISVEATGITLAGVNNTQNLVEGQPVLTAPTLSLSSGTLQSARVLIASGFSDGDQLSFTLPDNSPLTGSYDLIKGELSLIATAGSAPSADFEAALRTVSFSSGDDPTRLSADRQIAYLLDGQTTSTAYTTIIIQPTADDPVVTPGALGSFTEGGPAITIAPNLTLNDLDDHLIANATVTISTNRQSGDTLSLNNGLDLGTLGLASSFDASTGVLSLQGTATISVYQDVLRRIQFSSSNTDLTVNGTVPDRTISWHVQDANSDGIGAATGVSNGILTIQAINSSPLISPGANTVSLAYLEGNTAVVLDSGISLSDVDDDSLIRATVQISPVTPGDLLGLGIGAPATILAQFDHHQGLLLLLPANGMTSASLLDFQAALRSVVFSSSSDDPTEQNATRSISWSITDANSDIAASGSLLHSLPAATTLSITASNDAPLLGGAPTSTPIYEEAGIPISLAPDLTIQDADDLQLNRASVTISTGLRNGDILGFTPATASITGQYNADTGVLKLTGTASLAEYQQTLRSVVFSSTNDDPTGGAATETRGFRWEVADANSDAAGTAVSTAIQTSLNVQAINQAPQIGSSSNTPLTYLEGDPGLSLHPALTLSDRDSTQLASASISISTGFSAGDVLSLPISVPGITATYNDLTGVLTLTGDASFGDYQKALRQVTYSSTSVNPTQSSSTRIISLEVTDVSNVLAATSPVVTTTVTITPVNNRPGLTTIGTGVVSGTEDQVHTIRYSDLIGNASSQGQVSDPDGTVNALQVRELLSGTLLLGASLATATPFNASTHAQIDASTNAYWTPPSDTNGTGNAALAAFSVVAFDDSGGLSLLPRDVVVDVVPDYSDAAVITKVVLPTDGTYYTGDSLTFSITFDRMVTVITAGGTPTLPIILDNGVGATATYQGGSGSDTLLFKYVVSTGDVDSSGIALGSTLSLNGASISSIDDGQTVASLLTLPAYRSTSDLLVDGINDAPEITSPATLSVSYLEGDSALILNPELGLSDADSPLFSSATIRIANGLTTGDVLALSSKVATETGVQATWDTNTATLTLTPSSLPNAPQPSILNALRAMRSVTFASTSDHPTGTSSSRTIEWQISDNGLAVSSPAAGTFTLTPANDAPVFTELNAAVVRTDEDIDAEISFQNLADVSNASDIDGQVNAYVVQSVTSGSLRIGTTAQNAVPWSSGLHDLITGDIKAFWTPLKDINGEGLSAFTVVARDDDPNGSRVSNQAVAVRVDVDPVFDIAQITGIDLPAPGVYGPGSVLEFAVRFDRAVSLDPSGGLPSLQLQLSETRFVSAYLKNALDSTNTDFGSGDSLTFSYTVTDGDLTGATGIQLPSSLILPDPSRITSIDTGVTDSADLTLPSTNNPGVLIDAVKPSLLTIKEAPGSLSNQAVQSFRVSFAEAVRQVDATDFRLSATGSASGRITAVQAIAPVDGAAAVYDVTVSEISGLGRLILELKGQGTGITDQVGNVIASHGLASGSIDVERVGAIGRVGSDDLLSLTEATDANGVRFNGTVSQGVTGQPFDLWITESQSQTQTQLATINAQGDGSWSSLVSKSDMDRLASGSYVLTLKQGNAILGSHTVAIDRDAPTLSDPITDVVSHSFFIGGATLNKNEISNGLTIKGSTDAEDGQQLNLRLGAIKQSAVVNQQQWEVHFSESQLQTLSEGNLSLSLSVSDKAGNLTSTDHSLTLDTTALVNLSSISSDGWINIAESQQDLTISGSVADVEDGRSVTITVGSHSTNPATAYIATVNNGQFSTTISASDLKWTDGATYNVSVNGTDLAGNGFDQTRVVKVDLDAPTIDLNLSLGNAPPTSITASQYQGPINTANSLNTVDFANGVTLIGSASRDVSTTDLTINGINQLVTPVNSQGLIQWITEINPTTLDLPLEGSVVVSATVTDEAGNSANQTGSITVDRAASVFINSPVDGVSGNNILNRSEAQVLNFQGTTSHIQTDQSAIVFLTVTSDSDSVTLISTQASIGNGIWSAPIQDLSAFDNGHYIVHATVTDGAGNTATHSQAFSINTSPPVFTSLGVAGDNRINNVEAAAIDPPALAGLVSNAEDGQLVSITLPGSGAGSQRTLSAALINGAWSLPIPADLLSDYQSNNGTYIAQLSVSNRADNIATTSLSFSVDTSAPTLTFNNPTDAQWGASALDPIGNPLTITGTVLDLEIGRDVTIVMNGKSYKATRDSNNPSNWSLALTPEILKRVRLSGNQISISATDAAGNVEAKIDTFNGPGVDATPPTILELPQSRVINSNEGDLLIRQFKSDREVTWSLENIDAKLVQINPTTGGFSFFQPLNLADTNPSNLTVDDRSFTFTLVATDSRNNQRREALTLLVTNEADTLIDNYDQDGIAASIEDIATNGYSSRGDLNNDGIDDKYQVNVAAVPWVSQENFQAAQSNPSAAAPNSFASLQASTNVRIANVDVVKPEDLAVQGNSSSSVPAVISSNTAGTTGSVGVSIPYDPLVFRLESYDELAQQRLDSFVDAAPALVDGTDLYPGVQVRHQIDLPGLGLAMNTYLKWNPAANNGAGRWYEFLADGDPNTYDNGAELFDLNQDGLIDRILLTYTDGDPAGGDIDGLVNGIIDDPGMPALLSGLSVITYGGVGGTAPVAQYLPSTPPSLDINITLESGLDTVNSFFDLQLLRDFTTESLTLTSGGKRISNRRLALYGTGGSAAIPLTYNPITRRGARFYDTSGDGVADFVGVSLTNGQPGDFSASNATIRSLTRAGTADLNPVISSINNQRLRIADDSALATPASLRLKATLTSRSTTVNQIGYVVFDDGENVNAVLGDFEQVKNRARTLFSTLENFDAPSSANLSFEQEILLVNGQQIQFFEVIDATIDRLANLQDSRFSLINPNPLVSNDAASFSSKGGVKLRLNLLEGDQNLALLIGNDQGIAPVLNFSGFSATQAVVGSVVMAREASFDSITGFYRTVNAEGWVRDANNQLIRPGEAGYKAAALRTGNLVTELSNLSVGNGHLSQRTLTVTGENSHLAPYASVNGHTFFGYASANIDGYAHIRSLGNNLFGLEDILGGGDKDHDDLVFGFKFNQLI